MDFSGFLENNPKILDFVNRGGNCPGYFSSIFLLPGYPVFCNLRQIRKIIRLIFCQDFNFIFFMFYRIIAVKWFGFKLLNRFYVLSSGCYLIRIVLIRIFLQYPFAVTPCISMMREACVHDIF